MMAALVFSRSVLGSAGPVNADEISSLKLRLKKPLVWHVVSDLFTHHNWHWSYRCVIILDKLILLINCATFFGEIQQIMMGFCL